MFVSSFDKFFIYSAIFFSVQSFEIQDSDMSDLTFQRSHLSFSSAGLFLSPEAVCVALSFFSLFVCFLSSIFSFLRGAHYCMTSSRCIPYRNHPSCGMWVSCLPHLACKFLQGWSSSPRTRQYVGCIIVLNICWLNKSSNFCNICFRSCFWMRLY